MCTVVNLSWDPVNMQQRFCEVEDGLLQSTQVHVNDTNK